MNNVEDVVAKVRLRVQNKGSALITRPQRRQGMFAGDKECVWL